MKDISHADIERVRIYVAAILFNPVQLAWTASNLNHRCTSIAVIKPYYPQCRASLNRRILCLVERRDIALGTSYGFTAGTLFSFVVLASPTPPTSQAVSPVCARVLTTTVDDGLGRFSNASEHPDTACQCTGMYIQESGKSPVQYE